VGVLGHADLEARLPEGRRLLVAQDAGDRDAGEVALRAALAVDLGGGTDLGQHRHRDAHVRGDALVPAQGLEVHEHRARGVGDVGDVDAALGAAGEVPQQPGVGVAEHQVAGLGLLARTLDVVEDPLDLGAGEVGRQRQTDLRLVLVRVAATELVDDLLGAGVLPDDRVVDGLAGGLVPDDRGLALVRDADGDQVVLGDVRAGQGERHDLAGVAPDLGGVVLDPTGAREDLLVLELAAVGDLTGVVEDDRAGAGGALVDREDVLVRHGDGAFHFVVAHRVRVRVGACAAGGRRVATPTGRWPLVSRAAGRSAAGRPGRRPA